VPWSRPRSCVEPRCPGLVLDARASRCPPHQRAYLAAFEAKRPSASRRGYDARWGRARRAHLDAHPRCVRCGAVATDVDHITPLANGGTHSEANLRSYCHACHSWRTGRDQGHFRRR
jgi:5-methylcytosine-specific restriction enzyme A